MLKIIVSCKKHFQDVFLYIPCNGTLHFGVGGWGAHVNMNENLAKLKFSALRIKAKNTKLFTNSLRCKYSKTNTMPT